MCTWGKAKRDKSILSSERMLHKDYYCKSSVEKNSGRGSQWAWPLDELIGGQPPVVKYNSDFDSGFDFDFDQFSSVESNPVKRRLGGWCEMAASLGPS
jgi:hypothetical protein